MKKVLFLQNKILHYNKPLYNYLSDVYDVAVLHSGSPSVNNDDKYKEIIKKANQIGPFFYQHDVIKEVRSGEYHVVIGMFDVRWINNIFALFLKRKKTKFIWWGMGFGNSHIANHMRLYLTNFAHSVVLYSEFAKKNFCEHRMSCNNIFVANNTFHIENRVDCSKYDKNILLFVGTLDKRKELDVLIRVFYRIKNSISNDIELIIIGDGKEKNNLQDLISLSNDNKVRFIGKVENTSELLEYYQRALVSISLGQAGLSVLQSFGYGVPFLTKSNAISGGEISNIIDDINGFLCQSEEDISEKLIYICNNVKEAKIMGENAFNYYSQKATISSMANGFIDAINYKG